MPRRILLVQLPIPPAGLEPIRGNVPLAGAYLQLYAQQRGLAQHNDISLLPTWAANDCSDWGMVAEILDRRPDVVGFTCYLWNIDRTLWIAERLKQRAPQLLIVLGGPEITADNAWVLGHPAVDFAIVGEGEQTFCELLQALDAAVAHTADIPGLWQRRRGSWPTFRKPLEHLNDISSPYLHGLLDARDERMLLLETIRGCVFKCKFCYYPKSYDDLHYLAEDKIAANLRHAREAGVDEVVLLDPTLNQGRDFAAFARLLARENPARQFTYFGELRAEGINAEIAGLLRAANFTEVEIGLQSIDAAAQQLMDRKNNLKAFERGVRSLLDAGIAVKIDLIIGLPGDTCESIRRSFHYVRQSGLYSSVQIFNLAVLPGTAFRQEAAALGLEFQPRPPYYVLRTPTLELIDLYDLMAEGQDVFGVEFDPWPEPELNPAPRHGLARTVAVDLDRPAAELPPPEKRAQALSLELHASNFAATGERAAQAVRQVLGDCPHSTLQVVVRPRGDVRHVAQPLLAGLEQACFETTSYLDRYYSLHSRRRSGAKRLVVAAPAGVDLPVGWQRATEEYADVVRAGEAAQCEA